MKLYTYQEFFRRLGVSRSTWRHLTLRGELPGPTRLEGRSYVLWSEQYLRACSAALRGRVRRRPKNRQLGRRVRELMAQTPHQEAAV